MAILKLKKIKPKIICGIIVPNAIYGLYLSVPNRVRAEEIIKENFGIDPNRLISIEQPYANDAPVTIIVLYDLLISNKERYKYMEDELKNFNFPIFEYDRHRMPYLEEILISIKGENNNEK